MSSDSDLDHHPAFSSSQEGRRRVGPAATPVPFMSSGLRRPAGMVQKRWSRTRPASAHPPSVASSNCGREQMIHDRPFGHAQCLCFLSRAPALSRGPGFPDPQRRCGRDEQLLKLPCQTGYTSLDAQGVAPFSTELSQSAAGRSNPPRTGCWELRRYSPAGVLVTALLLRKSGARLAPGKPDL